MRPNAASTIRNLVALLAVASLPLCAAGEVIDAGSRCAVGGTNTARALSCAQRLETPGYSDRATQEIHPAESSRQGYEANVKSSENEAAKKIQNKTQSTDGAANKAQNGTTANLRSGGDHFRNRFQAAINHIQQVRKSLAATEQLIKNLEHVRDAYIGSSNPEAVRVAHRAVNDIRRLSTARTNLAAELEVTDRQAMEAKDTFEKLKETSNDTASEENNLQSLSAKDVAALAQQAAGSAKGGSGSKRSTAASAGTAAGARTYLPATHSLSPYGSSAGGEGLRSPGGLGNGGDSFTSGSASENSPTGYGAGSSITAPSGSPTSSASVGNLKDRLQRELASRKSDAAPSGSGGNTQPGAVAGARAEGGPTDPTEGADRAAAPGDLGLAIGLGDSGDFGDVLKGMLGVDGGAQPQEEHTHLASRELTSLGSDRFAPLPPEVLGAESESLFQRTRTRIETALKKGKVMNGLNSKL